MNLETLGSISLDTIIISIVVFALFFYIWRYGARRVNLFAISLPFAVLFTMLAPFKSIIAGILSSISLDVAIAPIIIFILSVFVSVWLLGHVILEITNKHKIKQAGIISVAVTMLLFVVFYHFVPIDIVYDFGSGIDSLFSSTTNAFWISLISYFAIGFARKM